MVSMSAIEGREGGRGVCNPTCRYEANVAEKDRGEDEGEGRDRTTRVTLRIIQHARKWEWSC